MAELVGLVASGISLAGLFKLCIDAFDIIRTCKKQELDLKKLTLRLNIERCRLYSWGKAVGLTESDDGAISLDHHNLKDTVQETLLMIAHLLSDTLKIESRYGCRQSLVEDDTGDSGEEEGRQGPIDVLIASFFNFNTTSSKQPQVVHKTRWVIHDRKKFGLLMGELKDLVNGLHNITTPLISISQIESAMKNAIRSIKDPETLMYVAQVTENEYQGLSVAASTKADTVSVALPPSQDIAVWAADVRADKGSEANTMEELESMDIRELKLCLLKMKMQAQEQSLSDPLTSAQAKLSNHDHKETSGPVHEESATKSATEVSLPPKPKPILMFHDAYQRSWKFPFEVCAKWRSMENMIHQAHQGFDADDLIFQRRYDLLGPSGEVIMPHVWEAIVEPGWEITLKPWPAPEPKPEPPPPPVDDSILTLDDILNPKRGKKKFKGTSVAPLGGTKQKPISSRGGWARLMSGGTPSKGGWKSLRRTDEPLRRDEGTTTLVRTNSIFDSPAYQRVHHESSLTRDLRRHEQPEEYHVQPQLSNLDVRQHDHGQLSGHRRR